MGLTPLIAMVRKDLQLFFSDPRAVIMTFVVPIAIASFFGAIFSGAGGGGQAARIPVGIVDQDRSAIAAGIIANAQADPNLTVKIVSVEEARDQVRRGKMTVGVVIPTGFGEAAGPAFFGGGEKPRLDLLYDPSHATELAMVRGILTEHVMAAVSREVFTGSAGRTAVDDTLATLDSTGMSTEQKQLLRAVLTSVKAFYDGSSGQTARQARGLTMPYAVREEAVTARAHVAYNAYAHAFAGMGVQFLLFA